MGRPEQGGFVRLPAPGRLLLVLLFLLLPVFAAQAATPAGTVISNTAVINYLVAASPGPPLVSNPDAFTVESIPIPPTRAVLQLLHHDPGGQMVLPISATDHDDGLGNFISLPVPLLADGTPVTAFPLPLAPALSYSSRQVIFIRLLDPDQNLNPFAVDTVLVEIDVSPTGDRERLRLYETGSDSGEFTGFGIFAREAGAGHDGFLNCVANAEMVVRYEDSHDATDISSEAVLVDPYGVVFDSVSGEPLDGFVVSLVNASTGAPAQVFADDGVTSWPSSMVSGGRVTDGEGQIHDFPAGNYRFPLVAPGEYRLLLTPPAGSTWQHPTLRSNAELAALPGGPFEVVTGSRGETFTVVDGPPLRVDIPVDAIAATLYVQRSADQEQVAAGDFILFQVKVENLGSEPVSAVVLHDLLPHAFRYRKGSARLEGGRIPDPAPNASALSLVFALGDLAPGSSVSLRYVAEAGAVRPGRAVSSSRASGNGGLAHSNLSAISTLIREDLLRSRSILMGRVRLPEADAGAGSGGIPGVRIYLEDGTYTVTDEEGRFHFEGVRPGSHVVQLDLDTLPARYEPALAEGNTRFAGRAWSQFVDMQGGTLWRVDFQVRPRPEPEGKVSLELAAEPAGPERMHYMVGLAAETLPLANLRLTVLLPQDASYLVGSSSLDGEPLPDPQITEGILTYRFSGAGTDRPRQLRLSAALAAATDQEELLARAALSYDTPFQQGQRTPVLVQRSRRGEGGPSAAGQVATQGLRSNTEPSADKEEAAAGPIVPGYDEAWLAAAPAGLEWLLPAEGALPGIASVDVAIKHDFRQKVELFLNGTAVPAVNFAGVGKNRDGVAMSRWSGVDLAPGQNRFLALVRDGDGREAQRLERLVHYAGPPARAELAPEHSRLEADGITEPLVAIRLLDREGYPARPGVVGEYRLSPPYLPARPAGPHSGNLAGAPEERPSYRISENGMALLRLAPTTQAGEAEITIPLADGRSERILVRLKPVARDWIIVGLAEGTVGYNILNGNREPLSGTAAEEHLYQDGRVAFFAKGRVRGDWLLTLAYDSDKEPQGPRPGLFGTIDPGTYYTLYADNSNQQYEATSSEKLYVRLEREEFYALFGDYETGLNQAELSRYSRSLTGLKAHYRHGPLEVIAFGSQSQQAFVRDEIRGQGSSGPYRLSRDRIVMNSEQVAIEVRDRFRSEVIVERRELARHLAYDIDYDQGTLLFREPVFSTDSALNHVFIVVRYESFSRQDKSLVAGGRLVGRLGRDLELGVSHVDEGRGSGEARLSGIDLRYRLRSETELRVELARSSDRDLDLEAEGGAWLAQVQHRGVAWDALAYLREQESGFGLGQTSAAEGGTRKIGLEAGYRPSQGLALAGQAYRQENLAASSSRDLLEGRSTLQFSGGELRLGVRGVRDELIDGSSQSSNQVTAGASRRFLKERITSRIDREQSLGSAGSVDFPSRTRLGLDYQLNSDTALFGEQEWADGSHRDSRQTRVGLKTRPWTGAEAFTSLSRQDSEESGATGASLGLRQRWTLSEVWSVDLGGEHSRLLSSSPGTQVTGSGSYASGPESGAFSTGSLGATYNPGPWLWTARLEAREGDNDESRRLATSVQTRLGADTGLLASLNILSGEGVGNASQERIDLNLGLAHRPAASRWLILDKLELIRERSGSADLHRSSWRIVNNLNTHYRASDRWQLALQYGGKYRTDTIDEEVYRSYVDLTGVESRYDLTEKWDVGVQASVLHSWSANQYDYSAGVSVGHSFATNIWLSLGYNLVGFRDEDFSRDRHTSQGPYIKFRIKFDQQSVKEVLGWMGR